MLLISLFLFKPAAIEPAKYLCDDFTRLNTNPFFFDERGAVWRLRLGQRIEAAERIFGGHMRGSRTNLGQTYNVYSPPFEGYIITRGHKITEINFFVPKTPRPGEEYFSCRGFDLVDLQKDAAGPLVYIAKLYGTDSIVLGYWHYYVKLGIGFYIREGRLRAVKFMKSYVRNEQFPRHKFMMRDLF